MDHTTQSLIATVERAAAWLVSAGALSGVWEFDGGFVAVDRDGEFEVAAGEASAQIRSNRMSSSIVAAAR